MLVIRLTKAFMVAALALFVLLSAWNNVVDWDGNYAFVQHVLSMDTTFAGSLRADRAITDPALWRLAYTAIIATETAIGLLLAIAALALLSGLRDGTRFARAKAWVAAGIGLGFALWFGGFMIAGGEYFQMWQSGAWNGQQPAFRFYMTMLGVLIFVSLPEPEPPAR